MFTRLAYDILGANWETNLWLFAILATAGFIHSELRAIRALLAEILHSRGLDR